MPAEAPPSRLTELRTSARGWHGVQLAVLGFIGLCGVLSPAANDAPRAVQVLSGVLAIAALVTACAATWLVARAAWPLYGAHDPETDDAVALPVASRRLTRGLALTFLAVALIALSAMAGWWPEPGDDAAADVQVQAAGQSFCGPLKVGAGDAIALDTSDRGVIAIPLDRVSAVKPVATCP